MFYIMLSSAVLVTCMNAVLTYCFIFLVVSQYQLLVSYVWNRISKYLYLRSV